MAPFVVVRDSTPASAIPRGAVVALGNFDGVHRGHRAVIDACRAMAGTLNAPAMALTFEPHPRAFFNPAAAPFRLTDETGKLRLLAGAGLGGAVVLGFDAARAATSAEDFIQNELVGRLEVRAVVVGYDFHFGKGRAGSPSLLAQELPRLGIEVDIQPHIDYGDNPVSSTAIRTALSDGRIADATAMLDGPWFVTGPVVHGEKRGRDLGYPTANIRLDPLCALRHGIYAVRTRIEGRLLDGVASYGRRPTFDNGAPLLETFLFDFKGDLYGRALDIAFIGFIRDEVKFDSAEALIRQMDADSAMARAMLASAPGAFPQLGAIA